MQYEHRGQKLLTRRHFITRLGEHAAIGAVLVALSVAVPEPNAIEG